MDFSGEDLVINGSSRLISRFLITNFTVTKLFDQVLSIAQVVVSFTLVEIITMSYLGALYFSTCILPSLPSISDFLIDHFISQIYFHKCLKVVTLLIMPIILSILMFSVLLLPQLSLVFRIVISHSLGTFLLIPIHVIAVASDFLTVFFVFLSLGLELFLPLSCLEHEIIG